MNKIKSVVTLALFALGITAFTSNAQAKPYLTLEFEAPTAVPFTCTNYDVRCFCPVVNCVFDDGSVTNLVNTTYINEGTEEKPIMVGQCDYGFGFVPDDDPAKTNKFVIEAGKHTVVVWGQPWSCASNTTPVTATIEITPPIETDNAFGTEYNPFALPTTMPHWISDLCWHDRWVNSYGPTYQFVVGMRDIRYGTLGPKGGIKGFTKQANWFLGTNTYYTTTDVWDENSVDHVREEKFSQGDHGFVKDTVMMKMSAEAEEALGKMPAGFSEDKVGLILQSAVCAVALPHEAHTVTDPLGTIEFGECNETFYSNFVFSVGGMAHTSSSSSWQAGQRINGEGYKDFLYGGDDGFGDHIAKFTSDRFTKNWETVNRTWIRFDDHYGKGLRSAIALLDEIPNDWKGTYRLAAKDDEQAIAAGTDWPVFDEDVYLDRGDIQMMKFSCHALNAVSKMLRAYYLTGDTQTELKQLEDLQTELFAIQAERNHDTWGFSSRIEHTIYNFFRMTPTMLSKIEDTEARDDASAAFKEAVRCYLNADAFIFGRWPSPTGDNFGGARDNDKLHLIELFEDEEGAEWNATGWRMIAENAWNSMSTQKAATIDLVKLGQQLHIKSGDTLIDFGGLGEKGDGAVALSFYDFFQGNLVHGVFKDDSAGIGLVTNGYTTATSDKIDYKTGDLIVKTNWTERLAMTVGSKTVDKNLGGIYAGDTLFIDLAKMAVRYPANGENRFLRGFASRFDAIYTCERAVVTGTTNLVENFIYTAEPTPKNGGAFIVSNGGELTGTNVTFAGNETTENGGAICILNGTASLKDAAFTGNKAKYGGGLYNGGVMTLDNILFSDNLSKGRGEDGAICNSGILNLDGPVTLVTTNDTVYNSGTLNWNLTNGKVGCLNGYQYLTNDKDFDSVDYGVLKLTVEDYTAMPTNFVIATGDFSNIAEALREKDTFSITNIDQQAAALGIKINGTGVATGTEPGNTLYRLVTEEDLEAGTTNLVLQVYEITVERFELTGTTNLVEGVYTAAPATDHGGAFNVSNGGELTGTNVTFEANEADDSLGGAIANSGGTVSLKDATFKGNKAWSAGALNNMNGLVNLDGVTFDGNKAYYGGAITSCGLINLDGPVTLVTASDTIDLMPGDGVQANEWYWDSVLNWNLAGGKAGLLNGYDKLINEAGVLKLTIDDALVTPTNIVIATGDFSDVEGKDTFTIMNVTANGAAAVIKIGGLISLDGTWWSLNIEGTNLVLSALATAKLDDVFIIDKTTEPWTTNATAVVRVDGKDVEPDEDGNYMIPKGYPVILYYRAQDDYVFPAGLKNKKVVLDSLTGDISMEETGYKPVAEPTWSDTRIVAFDTRERIVVDNVNDILPIAYSTNHWGMAPAGYEVTIETQREKDPPVTVVDKAHENGYAGWMPEYEAYGEYRVLTINQMAFGGEMQTDSYLYYSQPYALKQAVDGNGTFDLSAYTFEEGTVLGYDFVDVVAKPAEGSVFAGWTLLTNGVEVVGAFEDARALTNRFVMPCADTKILATFTQKTGCTVNDTDIAVGKGAGWEYTPAANGKMGTLELNSDEVYKIVLSGKLPSHTTVTAKPSEEPTLQIFNLNNFTNDVSDCDGAVALTVPAFRFGDGPVGIEGTNYLAAGAYASAIQVVGQTVTFSGTGSLTALPGTADTVLPAISCIEDGTCRIIKGTYNDAVDPALVDDRQPRSDIDIPHNGAFSNGDGTWTVKQYWQVTFDPVPVPPPMANAEYWMDVNDMTQRVVKGECAIEPAPAKSHNQLFTHWVTKEDQQTYDFTKEVKKDLILEAAYTDSGVGCETRLSDPVVMKNYAAGDLSNAVDRVAEGDAIMIEQAGQVCEDIEKPMLVSYVPDCVPTVTVGEGLTAVDSRDNDPQSESYGYGIIAIGELTQGAETNLVVVKGEALPSIETLIGEKPAEGITKELVEAATNFVRTVTAENLLALPADAMYPMAVDLVKNHGGDAVRTQVKLSVVATGLEPGAKAGALASVEMDIMPLFQVYSIKDGELGESPVGTYIPSMLQLSGEPVTVTFSVAALGQTPKLIEHKFLQGGKKCVECFYNPDDVKPGEKSFVYDAVAKTISFEMTEFSPVTVYFETELFPVVLDAGTGGYFGEKSFTTRNVYESTVGTGKYRNLVDPTPLAGGNFGGWYFGTTTKVANGDDFAAKGTHKLTAKWLYEQTVTVYAGEGGTATGSGVYKVGSTVTVQAFPNANWEFARWEADRLTIIGINPATFTMPANDVTITAVFQASAAFRAQCAKELAESIAAAEKALDAMPLTESEKALYRAALEAATAEEKAIIATGSTPAIVRAALEKANKAIKTVAEDAAEQSAGRIAAWDIGAGEIGALVKAELCTNGVLYISGVGPMADYSAKDVAPWVADGYAEEFDEVVVSSNITHIGSYAFKDCTELAKVDLTEFTSFSDEPVKFFGKDVFAGTEGVKLVVKTSELYKSLASLPSYRALDPRPMIVAPAVSFEFLKTINQTTEGEELDVAVVGGRTDRSTAVTVNFVKGTYTTAPTVYVDGIKAKFPLTLNWAKGEIAERTITLVTKATKAVEADRTFTLQLGSPAGNDIGTTGVASVLVVDATVPVWTGDDYVRALAWPANGGKVTGAGALKTDKSKLTLTAKANKWATFAGWYGAKKGDPNQIDLDNLITLSAKLPVGYGTEYGEGTYYAYFTDVLPVASVVDPDPTAEIATGVVSGEAFNTFVGMVGMQVILPVGLDDDSGKGTLSVSGLPSGLKFNKTTGVIYGAPTKACEKEVRIIAKNAAGKQTVYYTFEIKEIPANAVGTWNGVVRKLNDPEDPTHAGFGTVQFTAGKNGKLSAKVTTRLTGTKSFSTSGYELIDENTLGVEMVTKKGETFSAKLSLTNDWTTAQLFGTVTGGAYEANDEECYFAAIRNAFDKKDGNEEALAALELYKGTYSDVLCLRKGGTLVGSVTFKVQDGGKVQVKAVSENGTYSASCPGAFRITPEGLGAVQTAIRKNYTLWACDALLKENAGISGTACDYGQLGEDTHERIGGVLED